MKNVGFMRYLRQEWNKEKRATFGSTFIPFQSVELSLPGLLLSRASVRLTQLDKDKLTTDTVYFTLPPYLYSDRSPPIVSSSIPSTNTITSTFQII